MSTLHKQKRIQDESQLDYVRQRRCCVCNANPPSDASHIKTRGSGGGDQSFNLISHCRRHHTEWHRYGPKKFCQKYPIMMFVLHKKGWTFTADNKLIRITDFF